MLVKQEPAPTTLEQAVDKATAIDDPIENVARGCGKRHGGYSSKKAKVGLLQVATEASKESEPEEAAPSPKQKKRKAQCGKRPAEIGRRQ
ncbi:hypothetical protein PInf_028061 [Phytophthora infestans]|nr:hypothetical protein PInf_028061 [Phytophthora infestans]